LGRTIGALNEHYGQRVYKCSANFLLKISMLQGVLPKYFPFFLENNLSSTYLCGPILKADHGLAQNNFSVAGIAAASIKKTRQ
jgi:hypothetical protein